MKSKKIQQCSTSLKRFQSICIDKNCQSPQPRFCCQECTKCKLHSSCSMKRFKYFLQCQNNIQIQQQKVIKTLSELQDELINTFNQIEKQHSSHKKMQNILSIQNNYINEMITGKNVKQLLDNINSSKMNQKRNYQSIRSFLIDIGKNYSQLKQDYIQNTFFTKDQHNNISDSQSQQQSIRERSRQKIQKIKIKINHQIQNITNLFNQQNQTFLKSKIQSATKGIIISKNIIYKASQQSYRSDQFHKLCKGKRDTLTIIKIYGKQQKSGKNMMFAAFSPLSFDETKQIDQKAQGRLFYLNENISFCYRNPLKMNRCISYADININMTRDMVKQKIQQYEKKIGPHFGRYELRVVYAKNKNNKFEKNKCTLEVNLDEKDSIFTLQNQQDQSIWHQIKKQLNSREDKYFKKIIEYEVYQLQIQRNQ